MQKMVIGYDDIMKRLNESFDSGKVPGYPPFNVKKVSENKYLIELAVAGFGKSDLEIEMKEGVLSVKGNVKSDESDQEENVLYKGIAERAFTRNFLLADQVEVKNADLVNGMLKIWLERFVPDTKKISIND